MQRRLLSCNVQSAPTSRRYQNRKCTAPSQFGIVGAANWQRRLVRAEHTSAPTITTETHSQRRLVGAANVGSTDQSALHEVITHDFRAFFMGQLFRGDVRCASIQSTIVSVPSSALAPPTPSTASKCVAQHNSRRYQTKTQYNSRRYMTLAAPTIICCKYYYFVLYQRKDK